MANEQTYAQGRLPGTVMLGRTEGGDFAPFSSTPSGSMAFGSNAFQSSATITRPADTTAYAARDVISTSGGAVITFAGMGRLGLQIVQTEDAI